MLKNKAYSVKINVLIKERTINKIVDNLIKHIILRAKEGKTSLIIKIEKDIANDVLKFIQEEEFESRVDYSTGRHIYIK